MTRCILPCGRVDSLAKRLPIPPLSGSLRIFSFSTSTPAEKPSIDMPMPISRTTCADFEREDRSPASSAFTCPTLDSGLRLTPSGHSPEDVATVADTVAGASLDRVGLLHAPRPQTPDSTKQYNLPQTQRNVLARSAKPLCAGSIPARASNSPQQLESAGVNSTDV